MNNAEKQTIRNVIRRLKCAESKRHTAAFGKPSYGEAEEVRIALTGSLDPHGLGVDATSTFDTYHSRAVGKAARRYLDVWVIGALECLLAEEDGGTGRDLDLAVSLSK